VLEGVIQPTSEIEETCMLHEPLEIFHFTRYCSRCAAYVPFFLSSCGSLCALCDSGLIRSSREDQQALIGSLPQVLTSLCTTEIQARTALHSKR
jgi:hypothetical protein